MQLAVRWHRQQSNNLASNSQRRIAGYAVTLSAIRRMGFIRRKALHFSALLADVFW